MMCAMDETITIGHNGETATLTRGGYTGALPDLRDYYAADQHATNGADDIYVVPFTADDKPYAAVILAERDGNTRVEIDTRVADILRDAVQYFIHDTAEGPGAEEEAWASWGYDVELDEADADYGGPCWIWETPCFYGNDGPPPRYLRHDNPYEIREWATYAEAAAYIDEENDSRYDLAHNEADRRALTIVKAA